MSPQDIVAILRQRAGQWYAKTAEPQWAVIVAEIEALAKHIEAVAYETSREMTTVEQANQIPVV